MECGQSQQFTCIDNTTIPITHICCDIHTIQIERLNIKSPKSLREMKLAREVWGKSSRYEMCINKHINK